MGDSIALGVGAQLPACQTVAKVGIGSPSFAAAHTVQVSGDLVVISLGSNDGRSDTSASLEVVRSRITAYRVVWILPAVGARDAVRRVAALHGDRTLDVLPLVGRDGVHPGGSGYRDLARRATG
jgi:lysophospholipase L1-like esterase